MKDTVHDTNGGAFTHGDAARSHHVHGARPCKFDHFKSAIPEQLRPFARYPRSLKESSQLCRVATCIYESLISSQLDTSSSVHKSAWIRHSLLDQSSRGRARAVGRGQYGLSHPANFFAKRYLNAAIMKSKISHGHHIS